MSADVTDIKKNVIPDVIEDTQSKAHMAIAHAINNTKHAIKQRANASSKTQPEKHAIENNMQSDNSACKRIGGTTNELTRIMIK